MLTFIKHLKMTILGIQLIIVQLLLLPGTCESVPQPTREALNPLLITQDSANGAARFSWEESSLVLTRPELYNGWSASALFQGQTDALNRGVHQ